VRFDTELIVNGHNGSRAMISIHDLSGKCLRTFNAMIENDAQVIPLKQIGNWPNGTYFIKMVIGSKLLTSKMIVAH